jgi:hypothetical protein
MELAIPHLDKMRIVLKPTAFRRNNSCRSGALMVVGQVMNTPEVSRVYMEQQFWGVCVGEYRTSRIAQREMDLLTDIMSLPQQAVMRRINELVSEPRCQSTHLILFTTCGNNYHCIWGKRRESNGVVGQVS